MHKFIPTLFLLFAIFIAPGAHADLDSKQAVTQQLMELSGMEKQVGQMAGLASTGLTMYQGKLPAELYDILNRALIEAYDPSKIKQIVFTHRHVETLRNGRSEAHHCGRRRSPGAPP